MQKQVLDFFPFVAVLAIRYLFRLRCFHGFTLFAGLLALSAQTDFFFCLVLLRQRRTTRCMYMTNPVLYLYGNEEGSIKSFSVTFLMIFMNLNLKKKKIKN